VEHLIFVAYAFAQFHTGEPATPTRLASFVLKQFQIPIIPDTLRKLRLCDGRLKPVIGKSSEFDRVHISSRMISDYFTALGRVPSGFLWNMDESGPADWPDAHPETVSVPIKSETDSVRHLWERRSKTPSVSSQKLHGLYRRSLHCSPPFTMTFH
jgi:hypothetical protein